MSKYTWEFRRLHQLLGRHIPIDLWTETVGKHYVKDSRLIYNPVTLYVKLAGALSDPNGTVMVQVPFHEANWYETVKNGVAKMIGLTDSKGIELKDMIGKEISGLNRSQLGAIGEVDVYIDGKCERVSVRPSAPPELSTRKVARLGEWFDRLKNYVSDAVANVLKTKTLAQLEEALSQDGEVQKTMESLIKAKTTQLANMSWEKFCQVYRLEQGSKIQHDPDAALSDISTSLLAAVREVVGASEPDLVAFYSSSASSKENGIKPLFSSSAVVPVRIQGIDAYNMYRDIALDALEKPGVRQRIVRHVYRRPLEEKVGHFVPGDPYFMHHDRRRRRRRHHRHPRNWWLHNWFYPVFQHIPAYYSGSPAQMENASFDGEPDQVHRSYNVLSRRHPVPKAPIQDELPPLVSRRVKSTFPEETVSIEGVEKIPDLVPLAQEENRGVPDLVPLSNMPLLRKKLVPLRAPTKEQEKSAIEKPLFKKAPKFEDFL